MIDTLAAAKRELWEAMKGKGMACPCCQRFAKVQPTPITRAQVNAFRWICDNLGPDGFVEVQRVAPDFVKTSNSHGKLKHWDLLQQKPNKDTGKKCSGVWGPTEFGREFLGGRERVQKYALLWDDRCFGFRGEFLRYDDLFDPFDYGKLMQLQVTA